MSGQRCGCAKCVLQLFVAALSAAALAVAAHVVVVGGAGAGRCGALAVAGC